MTKTIWAIALAVGVAVLFAQTPPAGLSFPSLFTPGEPLLGFASENGNVQLHAVLGTARQPRFGSVLAAPEGTRELYLAPRQRYALLDRENAEHLSVWMVSRPGAEPESLPTGAPGHPSSVVFSPSGDSAALISGDTMTVSVMTGLPSKPRVAFEVATGGRSISTLALADSGAALAVDFGDGMPLYSIAGGAWLPLPNAGHLRAAVFLPQSRSLVWSDTARGELILLPSLSEALAPERVLVTDIAADQLAVTSDGDEIAAVSKREGKVWEIPLAAGAPIRTLHSAQITGISTLRDGHVFLLSSFPALTLFRAAASEFHTGH